MSNITRPIHPLFDELSEYRFATATSVFHDDGRNSVRQWFHARARETRRVTHPDELPEEAAAWGLAEDRHRSVQELLREDGERVAAQQVTLPPFEPLERERLSQMQFALRAPDRGDELVDESLALLQIDLDSEPQTSEIRREPRFIFPGMGLDEAAPLDEFRLNVPGLPANRRCLALILDQELVDRLARQLQLPDAEATHPRLRSLVTEAVVPAPSTGEVARTAIVRCLARETLMPADLLGQKRASRISLLLSLAPALQGVSNKDGRFDVTVPLHQTCPGLERGSWVVLCLGPEV